MSGRMVPEEHFNTRVEAAYRRGYHQALNVAVEAMESGRFDAADFRRWLYWVHAWRGQQREGNGHSVAAWPPEISKDQAPIPGQ